MIYIVHIDAWDSEKKFHELTDEEIVKMYEEDTTFIDCYNDMNELAAAWNSDECFYPNMSYMRVINEPEYVYLVKQESNVDGELHFNVVPCKDMETAKRVLADEVHTLLTESPKYKDAKKWIEGNDALDYDDCPYSWENDKDDAFYISCTCDDYHELITIEKKEIN